MLPPDHPEGSIEERFPPDFVEADAYGSADEGFEHGLVVLAMELPYWLIESAGRYRLLVEVQHLEDVRAELACYDHERAVWPPQPVPEPRSAQKISLFTPLLWALAVLVVFGLQGERPGRLEDAGALNSEAVFIKGEWWRIVTALFLHADVGHLVSNVLSGVFVFSAVLTTIGLGRGWLLLAGASVAGNFLAVGLHYSVPYQSLGASTAIFAGLGLLTGRAARVVRRTHAPHRWRPLIVPLAAGVAMLGLFGTSGILTDVVAHAMGFAAGLISGCVFRLAYSGAGGARG